ncbi:hypothetical protein [Nonomuraea soli]|uniref:Uncharacterized protein n=1 Tax=Nonomuraea soli TaxID=1032476 RepID=A0A7W0HUG2_9ACTN|nr:hypothetical protein [Nonomuraea soli]MBA2896065.1 hypothetical protein [Nonomuraea soli]
MTRTLPSLDSLKAQAKQLRRAVAKGNPAALARAGAAAEGFTLREAQLVLAREYGYAGWHELVSAAGDKMIAERDLHRWFAVELNNDTWDQIEQDLSPGSTPAERERALYGAYAAALHWLEVGDEANHARAEHLISATAVAVGLPDVALRHARRCAQLVREHPEAMADWDHAFAAEGLARACAAAGLTREAAGHLARARSLTAALAGAGDRDVLERRLAAEPWFGLG